MKNFKVIALLTLLTAAFVGFQNASSTSLQVQVQPGKLDKGSWIYPDIGSAVAAVASLKTLYQPVTITIQPGRYVLSAPIQVNMPTNIPVLNIQAQPGASVQLSGEQYSFANSWQASSNNAQIAQVTLPKTITNSFKNLYASDGKFRPRSRHPSAPRFYTIEGEPTNAALNIPAHQGFRFKEGLDETWDFTQVELVALQMFRAPRLKIKKVYPVDSDGFKTVEFTTPAQASFNISDYSPELSAAGYRYRFYTDNVATVDSPGEWYFDLSTHTLLYYLGAGEKLVNQQIVDSTGAPITFEIPSTTFNHAPLLAIGDATHPQQNVTVQGLQLTNTDWDMPNGSYAGSQALSPATATDYFLSPALSVFCSGCSVISNTFSQLGGHAIQVTGQGNLLKMNLISNIGASGIVLGNRFEKPSTNSTGLNRIWDNEIQNTGTSHFEGVGIIGYLTSNSQIEHNLIRNIPYSGISLGWDWLDEYTLANNIIDSNDIENTMQQLNDGAGIYVVGNQSGSAITNNYVSGVLLNWQVIPDGLYGLYFDRGSANFLVQDNFVAPATTGNVKLSRGTNNQFNNNYFYADVTQTGPFFTIAQNCPNCGNAKDGSGNSLSKNIFESTSATNTQWITQTGTSVSASDYNDFYNSAGNSLALPAAWLVSFEKNSLRNIDPKIVYTGTATSVQILDNSPALHTLGIQRIGFSGVGPRYSPLGYQSNQ